MRDLKKRAYAGVLSLILFFPGIIFEFLRDKLSGGTLISFYIFTVISFLTFAYFMWGFKIIGDKTSNRLLSISTILLLIISLSIGLQDLFSSNIPETINFWVMIGAIILIGGLSIPFGIGLLKLKEQFGELATATGVLTIISGACGITVILFFISLLLLFPLAILEIILLFKASDKLKI